MKSISDVPAMQASHQPGETVTVTALRPLIGDNNGMTIQPVSFSVTLA
jgi:hypothetical protein